MAEESAALQEVREYRQRRDSGMLEEDEEWKHDAKLLWKAMRNNELDAVKFLLEQGAPVQAGEYVSDGGPLMYASCFCYRSLVEWLLRHAESIDVNATNSYGDTALHMGAGPIPDDDPEPQERVLKVVQLLVEEWGADPMIRNNAGKRPSDCAREGGFSLAERYLLDQEEMVEQQNQA